MRSLDLYIHEPASYFRKYGQLILEKQIPMIVRLFLNT